MTTGSFRADDHGHFVILSSAFPSRLLTAFPAGTPIERMPLAQALAEIRSAKSEIRQSGLPTETSLLHDKPQ